MNISLIFQIENFSKKFSIKNATTADRLKKIHEIPNVFNRKCKLCNSRPKKIWKTARWTYFFGETVNIYYCKKCLPTKEDVLYEIDTDESAMGIAYCDSPISFKKLNYSRCNILPPIDE